MLRHRFQHRAECKNVLAGVTNFDGFMKNLREIARTNFLTIQDGRLVVDEDARAKFIGDGFELFGEYFITRHRLDNRIYINDFRPNDGLDNGIDGFGTCTKTGKHVYVQFKGYNENTLLTGEHLNSFVGEVHVHQRAAALRGEKIDFLNYRMVVVTSARDMNGYTKDVKYRGFVECYAYNDLKKMTNNAVFWDELRHELSA